MSGRRTPIRWVLWSPRRFGAVIVALLVLVVLIGSVSSGGPSHHHPARTVARAGTSTTVATTTSRPAESPTTSTPGTSASSQATVAPLPPPSFSPALPSPAAQAATVFVTAWAAHTPDPGWLNGVRPLVTADLAAGLASTDPASVPAHHVIGLVTGTGDSGGGQAVVSTDAGPIDVVMVVSPLGAWLVSDVEPGTR